jgi:hypothetical protein
VGINSMMGKGYEKKKHVNFHGDTEAFSDGEFVLSSLAS